MEAFTQDEIYRYSRHFSVDGVGISGQQKLKSARVLLVGAGGIGSPAALYLTSNGIGKLGIIDHDLVELSNLQRQILFDSDSTGKEKATVAGEKLSKLNPNTDLHIYPYALSPDNAIELFSEYDIIIDGSDNYPTRYLVNDACRHAEVMLVSASIYQFSGQLACFAPKASPCYRCLYPAPPPPGLIPNCAQAGVLGVIPGILATLAVAQTLKIILNIGDNPIGQLLEFDALGMKTQTFKVEPNPNCECCKQNKDFTVTTHPEDQPITEINASVLNDIIASKAPINIIDVREKWERDICKIEPSFHTPLSELASADLPCTADSTIIAYCKGGVRSKKAAKILMDRGFTNVASLSGGILDWIDEIQPTLMKY